MQTVFMTYNIQHGYMYRCPKSTVNPIDLSRTTEVIRQSGAEIIGLNEVRGLGLTPDYTAQAETMAASLGYHCFFGRSFYVNDTEPYGNAVLSRYPIVEARVIRIPGAIGVRVEPRSVTRAVIEVPDGRNHRPIAVFSTHFDLSEEGREHAVSLLLSVLRDEALPFVLMGDFNTTPDSPLLEPLYDRLVSLDAGKDALTYPSHEPEEKIDYIFGSAGMKKIRAEALEAEASDHRPLVSAVEW